MGDAVQRLRNLLALTKIYVPPHMSVTKSGHPIQVDGYWRRGGKSAPSPRAIDPARAPSVTKVHVEFVGGTSSKFWKSRVYQSGSTYIVESRWGKIGTDGQVKMFEFNTLPGALTYFESKKSEKIGKGYKVISSGGANSTVSEILFEPLGVKINNAEEARWYLQNVALVDMSADTTLEEKIGDALSKSPSDNDRGKIIVAYNLLWKTSHDDSSGEEFKFKHLKADEHNAWLEQFGIKAMNGEQGVYFVPEESVIPTAEEDDDFEAELEGEAAADAEEPSAGKGTIVTITPLPKENPNLVYVEYQNYKFWKGAITGDNNGAVVAVEWGVIGGKPQKKEFSFPNIGAAQIYLEKKKQEKFVIGYNLPGQPTGVPAKVKGAKTPKSPKAPKAPKMTKAKKKLTELPPKPDNYFSDAIEKMKTDLEAQLKGWEEKVKTYGEYVEKKKGNDYYTSYYQQLLDGAKKEVEAAKVKIKAFDPDKIGGEPGELFGVDALKTQSGAEALAALASGAARSRIRVFSSFGNLKTSPVVVEAALDNLSSKDFRDSLTIAIARLETIRDVAPFADPADNKRWRARVGRDRRRLEDVLHAANLIAGLRDGSVSAYDMQAEKAWLEKRLASGKGSQIFGASWGGYSNDSMRGEQALLGLWRAISFSIGEYQSREFLKSRGLTGAPDKWDPDKTRGALRDVLQDHPIDPFMSALGLVQPYKFGDADVEVIDSLSADSARAWLLLELNDFRMFDGPSTDSDISDGHPLSLLYGGSGYAGPYRAYMASVPGYATNNRIGRNRIIDTVRKRAVGAARYEAAYKKALAAVQVPNTDGPDVVDEESVKALADAAAARAGFRVKPRAKYVLNADVSVYKNGDVFEYDPDPVNPVLRWRRGEDSRIADAEMEALVAFSDPEGETVPRYLSDDDKNLEYLAVKTGPSTKITEQGDLMKAMKIAGANYVGKMSLADKRRWVRLHNTGLGLLAFALEVEVAAKGEGKGAVVHKDFETNPASPGSPQGKVALQVLADLKHTQPWGEWIDTKTDFSKWPAEAQQSLRDQFGIPEEAGDLVGDFATPIDVLEVWSTLKLPSPSDELMPVVLSKPEIGRPASVSPETWELVTRIEADPNFNPLTMFWPTADGIESDADLDTGPMPDGRAWKDVLPPSVHRLFQWARNSDLAVKTGGASAPPDLSDAIQYRAEKGAYDPPPVPGTFGVIGGGSVPYYLRQADRPFAFEAAAGPGWGSDKLAVNTAGGSWTDYLGNTHNSVSWVLVTDSGVYPSNGEPPAVGDPARERFWSLLTQVLTKNTGVRATTDPLDTFRDFGTRRGVFVDTASGRWLVGAENTNNSAYHWFAEKMDGSGEIIQSAQFPIAAFEGGDARILRLDGSEVSVPAGQEKAAVISEFYGGTPVPWDVTSSVAEAGWRTMLVDEVAAVEYTPQPADSPARPVPRKLLDLMGVPTGMWDVLSDLEQNGLNGTKKGPWLGAPSDDRLLRDQVVSMIPRRESVHIPRQVLAFIAIKKQDKNFDSAMLSNFVAMVRAKTQQGHYGLRSIYVDPDAQYYKPLMNGLPASEWTAQAKKAFADDFGFTYNYGEDDLTPFQQKVDEIFGVKDTDVPVAAPALGTLDVLEFTKAPLPKTVSKGGHTKDGFLDQFGRPWFAKAFPHDPNARARSEAEHYANLIGRLHGFRQPPTDVRTGPPFGKGHVFIQLIKDYEAVSLASIPFSDLSDLQISEAAQEHVLDWLLSNHDTHPDNLLRGSDGHIFGVDKGQAWKSFGQDKLVVDFKLAGNFGEVWYNQFYHAILNKQISKDRADKIVKSVLARAVRMSTRHDEETRVFLEKAFANRKDFGGLTREQFIDAIMARKAALGTDFETLYKGIYAKAGLEWALPPLDQLAKSKVEVQTNGVERTAFTSLGADVLDAAVDSQSHGVTIMLNSPAIDESFVVLQRERVGESDHLVGELTVRSAADATVLKWIKQHTVTNDVVTMKAINASEQAMASDLPSNQSWYATIVNAAKTVNAHQTDGEYNPTSIASLKSAMADMEATKAGKFPNGMSEYDKAKSLEMADYYLSIGADILKAMDAKSKTPNKSYALYAYVPEKKGAPVASIASEWKGGLSKDSYLKKLSDGTYELTLGSNAGGLPPNIAEKFTVSSEGSKATLSAEEGEQLLAVGEMGWAEAGILDQTSLQGNQIKVFVRSNTRVAGLYAPKTGTLSAESESKAVDLTGKEYDIEVGNLVIEYRPHAGANVLKSQQGLMRFRIKNFSGSETEVQQAFDLIQQMGVSMESADEESLELLYWQLVTAQANDRKGHGFDAKLKALAAEVEPLLAENEPSVLLPIYKKYWAEMIGQERVDNADWMPRFDRLKPHTDRQIGKPTWQRPDATAQELREKALSDNKIPTHSWQGHDTFTDGSGQYISGAVGPYWAGYTGLLATTERIRVLGRLVEGMSSVTDMKRGSGSYYFLHPKGRTSDSVFVDPSVFARLFTYAQGSDTYGNVVDPQYPMRRDSVWKIAEMRDKSAEAMVKYHLSPYDLLAVQVKNAAEVIEFYKSKGVTDFDGILVERMFLSSNPSLEFAKENLKMRYEYFKARGIK